MTEKRDLSNRADLTQLLERFYAAARQEERLAPVFDSAIAGEEWPGHLARIADFWETILFHVPRYSGAPIPAHLALDRATPLDSDHFKRWLSLFHAAVDALFEGVVAEEAKRHAALMAPLLLYKIEASRKDGFVQ